MGGGRNSLGMSRRQCFRKGHFAVLPPRYRIVKPILTVCVGIVKSADLSTYLESILDPKR